MPRRPTDTPNPSAATEAGAITTAQSPEAHDPQTEVIPPDDHAGQEQSQIHSADGGLIELPDPNAPQEQQTAPAVVPAEAEEPAGEPIPPPEFPPQEDSRIVSGEAEPPVAAGERTDGWRDPENRRDRESVEPVKADSVTFPNTTVAGLVFALWGGGVKERTASGNDGPDWVVATRGEGSINVVIEKNRDAKRVAENLLPRHKQAVRLARDARDAHAEEGRALRQELRNAKYDLSRTDLDAGTREVFENSRVLLERDVEAHVMATAAIEERLATAQAEHDGARASLDGYEIVRIKYPLAMPKGAVTIG